MATASMGFIVGKIISILENEASLLGGVHDELSEMTRELESMRAFLEDADQKRGLTEGEKFWVANVRDRVYEVENIIDDFVYHMNTPQKEGKLQKFVNRAACLAKNLLVKHQLATKLQKVNKQIKAIPERQQRYGVERIESRMTWSFCRDDLSLARNIGESSFFLSDDDVVGIEQGRELLVSWLTEGEPRRTVMSVVGMGGSGKTTLAAQAYNSHKIKSHFECYAWITVSQTYRIEDLFRNMIREFHKETKEMIPPDLDTMGHRHLVQMLVNYLETKRYIVVLDDVWHMNLWTEIKISLPDGRHGSRILLTTRKHDIATFCQGVGSHIYPIRPLGKAEAWVLFCKKAFQSNPNRCCPRELESLGRDLVEKCKGLPLAIVALGGLMSSKNLEGEWSQIRNSLNWELSNNPMLEIIKTILFLSFNELPYQLKHCFLYCCVFPEDFLIRRKRLIRLWMAEGFVKEIRGVLLEQVAESYLMELVRRSMLQVVRRNPSGRPKECKMHDLMRELALSTSEREKFCNVHDGREDTMESKAISRRLSIQAGGEVIKLPIDMSRIRSFFVFPGRCAPSDDLVPNGFRLLRVLDMENSPIDRLPDGFKYLFNLRYLNMRNSRIKELPNSIGRLSNLQTLNIDRTMIRTLPIETVKLQALQYLIMTCYVPSWKYEGEYFINGIWVPSNICTLNNLQVLSRVKADSDIIRRLKNMTQLVKFGITGVKQVDDMDLCTSIQNMNLLRQLFVSVSKDEVLRMDTLSSPPPHLRRLELGGVLEKVPNWFQSLDNLTHLKLQRSGLREDPLPYIQAFPNLVSLELLKCYEGKQLYFCSGFQKLERLEINDCPQLNEIIIEKGVMPSVETLALCRCGELKMLPQGMEHLINLQSLYLIYFSEEFIAQVLPKLQHMSNNIKVRYSIAAPKPSSLREGGIGTSNSNDGPSQAEKARELLRKRLENRGIHILS